MKEKPVGDDVFEIFRRMYAYDKTPLDPKTEGTNESNEYFRKEKVSYRAAYGDERVPAFLYLPRNARPPYQTVLWVPGGYASYLRSSETGLPTEYFKFLLRTGRAVLYPVCKGAFERRIVGADGPNAYRDRIVQFVKDAFRSVDFLESRPEIQRASVGYYGLSLGAVEAPIILALEPRLKAGILVGGGLWGDKLPPEVDWFNFAPRVHGVLNRFGGCGCRSSQAAGETAWRLRLPGPLKGAHPKSVKHPRACSHEIENIFVLQCFWE